MAIENPVRLLSRGQMETVLGAFGETLNPITAAVLPDASTREARDIGRLMGRQTHTSSANFVEGSQVRPHRSGSAPPSVEGSLAAMGGLFTHHPSSTGAGGLLSRLGDAKSGYKSEQELRSDPNYLSYYYSHINLNPRLPPPLISWENWRLAQGLHCGTSRGDDQKLISFDDSNSNSLFCTQPVFPSQTDELQDLERARSRRKELARDDSRNWSGGSGSFKDLSSPEHETISQSIADLNQDNFFRAPSPMYSRSRPPSRASVADDVVSDLDAQHALLQNTTIPSVTELSAMTGPASRSLTPIPEASQVLSFPQDVSSSDRFLSRTRPSTPELPVVRSASPGRTIMGSTNGGDPYKDAAASVTELKVNFQSMDLSHGTLGSSYENHTSFQHTDTKSLLQKHSRQQSRYQQIPTAQAHKQVMPTESNEQVPQQHHYDTYFGTRDAQHNATAYASSSIVSHGQVANVISNVQTGAVPPNVYAAAAAAAMSYMAAANPYYQSTPSIYGPHYGVGAYPFNPPIFPPMIANYNPMSPLPIAFDTTAASSARAILPGTGLDLPQLYNYTGHAAPNFQSPLGNPMWIYMGGVTAEDNDPNKDQAGAVVSKRNQMPQSQRSGTRGIPVANIVASAGSPYYGSPNGVNFFLPSYNSPIGSPILPGSPVALPNVILRRDDQALQLPSGTGRVSNGVHSGWQSPRSFDANDFSRKSSLLEEFKSSKTRQFELSDITGHVIEFSADQHGSRFIQQKLEVASLEEKEGVFDEVLPRALSFMTDVFGNYVIQKFFEHGTQEQRKVLANQLTGHVLTLSLQVYGCRVIQKALEVVDVEQQVKLVSELDGHVMRCVRDQNGNHVIQKCIECIPFDKVHFIISAFYGEIVVLSTHPYGCRVIQRVLEHCTDIQTQKIVMEEILSAACNLAQDQYGNYVVQHVLEHGRPLERSKIIRKLAGQIVQMSQHKFASNVIEKCLEFGGPEERQVLITEMLGSTDENEPLQAMMKDQFANYVVQKVLETSDDKQRELLLTRIRLHLHALKKYTYGKHIVARVEKLLAAGERRSAAQGAEKPA